MKKRTRFILYISIASLVFLWLIKVPILSLYVSDRVRLPISMEWVGVWPTETTIRDFLIKNPKSFQKKAAMSVENMVLDYEISSVFATPSVFDKILLQRVEIDVDFINSSDNNWTLLSAKMPKPTSLHPVIVKKLIAKDITIRIKEFNGREVTRVKHVDHLELSNINSDRGFPTERVIREVFGKLDLKDVIEDAFDPFGLFEGILSE